MADAFHLNVYKYILKSDLSSLKECVLFAYKHFQKTGLIVKSVDGQHFIKYQDIIYIESHYKKIFLYTCEEELLILVPSLKDFYNQLPSQFILINKQNIINFDKIILYNQNKILLEGEKDAFVVSRRKAKEVKDKYIIHMQRK